MITPWRIRNPKIVGMIIAVGVVLAEPASFIAPAHACAKVVPPACISVVNCGRKCVQIINRCNFVFAWHADLRHCRDQTGSVAPGFTQTFTPGCDIRAISMC